MALKGDLSTIGLAEVFQMISMSQKQGTLIVQDAESRKCIYFGENGVKLLSTGKRKGLRLGDMLVRAGKISEVALQDALENAKIQKKLVGEVLVESGVVTEKEIQEVVRSQIEEEIYDLFVWKKAIFEFIEGPPSEALRDPEAPVTQLTFDVNGLLLEAVRRADEWNLINQKIPSFDSIFLFVSEDARREEDRTAPDALKRIYRLIDGRASVSEIVEQTGLSRFEVCKALLELIDRGRIRILNVHEMMDVAARKMQAGEKEAALRLYHAAALQAPRDSKVLLGVARILEGEGANRESAAAYARAGRLFLEQGDAGRALEHLQKALTLSPEDGGIRLGLFEAQVAAGNLEAGKKLAQEILAKAMMGADYALARMVCDRISSVDPNDLYFRTCRARIFHRTGQKKDLEAELAFIREHMPADPAAMERILHELREVMGPPSGVKRPTAPKTAPRRRSRGRWVAAGLLGIFLVGVGFAGKYELEAHREFVACLDRSRELASQHRYEEARRLWEGFRNGRYRFSYFQKGKVRQNLDRLAQEEQAWTEGVKEEAAKRRERMRGWLKERWEEVDRLKGQRLADAIKVLETLRDEAEKEGFPEDARRAEETAKAFRNREREADELRRQGEALEEAGKFMEAALLFDRILRDFPNTDAVVGIQFPLGITTIPSGVTVTNVRSGRVVGTTGKEPLKLRMKYGEAVRLRFQKEGYVEKELDVQKKTMGHLKVVLTEKVELWFIPLGVRIEHEPLLLGDRLYVAVSNKIYALSTGEKGMAWSIPELLEGQIEVPLRAVQGWLLAGTGAGWIYAVDPSKPQGKRVTWKHAAGDRVTGGLEVDPGADIVYAGVAGRMIHALEPREGRLLWKRELPGDCVGIATGAGGLVLVACRNGTLVALKGPSPAEEVWRFEMGTAPGPLLVDREGIFTVGSDQQVWALRPEGRLWWKRPVSGASSARPGRIGEVLFVPTREGKIQFLSIGSGEILGHFSAGGPVPGGVAVRDSLAYFGSEDGCLYCFDPVLGQMRWFCRSKAGIRTAPVLGATQAFYVAGDVVGAVGLD